MGNSVISLLVLAGIALFLILKLRSVLGTREGFEKPVVARKASSGRTDRPDLEVIEGGVDADITDHVPDGSESAKALAAMKMRESGFNVSEFLSGARGAYEMILMAFENGELDQVQPFLSEDVFSSFDAVVKLREEQGLIVEANFVGVRELALQSATLDRDTGEAELRVKFVGELTSAVRNASGEIVEGNPKEIKRQRDIWTFSRIMGASDPNWRLVATGE